MFLTVTEYVNEVVRRVRNDREELGLEPVVCVDSVRNSFSAGLSIETAARIAFEDTERI